MVKHVMVLALALASVTASAHSRRWELAHQPQQQQQTPQAAPVSRVSSQYVTMDSATAQTYVQGIRELSRDGYQTSGGGCTAEAYQLADSVMGNATIVAKDSTRTTSEPVILFVQNADASRDGEVKNNLFVRTNPSTKQISTLTVVQTRYANQLVDKDPAHLRYGVVGTDTTTVCSLAAVNPRNPSNPTN